MFVPSRYREGRTVIFDWLYGLDIWMLYPVTFVLIAGASEIGNRIGLRSRSASDQNADIGTVAGASLGLLALLVAFSFSMAEARYESRRTMVLEEANAIGTTGNFALMLPEPARYAILDLLREYAAVRIDLGVHYDPHKMDEDIAKSLDLQTRLWQQAVAVTAANPQSLPAYRFVASLNEMTNIHESRLTSLRNHVPVAVTIMLIGTAMVAMGFTGYNAGLVGARRILASFIMSVTIALLIMLIVDLDRPYRGLIQVPIRALVDAAASIPR